MRRMFAAYVRLIHLQGNARSSGKKYGRRRSGALQLARIHPGGTRFVVSQTLLWALQQPDASTGKMPVGPTAKMAVLLPRKIGAAGIADDQARGQREMRRR